jgi:hypothetical protein
MKKLILTCLLASWFFSGTVAATPHSAAEYQQVFATDNLIEHKAAIGTLALAGLSDPALFDLIQSKLIASLAQANTKAGIDYSAWLIKGLSYSGNPVYRQTILDIQQGKYHKKLRRYAQEGLDNLAKYARWNPILVDSDNQMDAELTQVKTFSRALASDELELKRLAAKLMVSERFYHEDLLALLQTELQAPRLLAHERLAIDTYAWMAKALASSGDRKYQAVIADIANNSKEKKLRKYAAKYLKTYY